MRKTYKCSNIKFCMEDENQRRTWKYLQGISRKDGSYGKVLSDVFVAYLDGKVAKTDLPETKMKPMNDVMNLADIEVNQFGEREITNLHENVVQEISNNISSVIVRNLDVMMDEKTKDMQEVFAEQIRKSFNEYVWENHSTMNGIAGETEHDGMEQVQEPELSEDMMAFALAMGE